MDRPKEETKLAHDIHVTQATIAAELDSAIRTYEHEIDFIENHPGTYVLLVFSKA
jgi:hypothetical protein